MRRIEEVRGSESVPIWRQPEWVERFPWLYQGTTGRGGEAESADFGLFGAVPVAEAFARWRRLREASEMTTAVHSRQVHGSQIAEWAVPLPPGLLLTEGVDAHLSSAAGILLTVSVADCVPVFLVGDESRVVALVHAGWRGIAEEIIESAIDALIAGGVRRGEVWLHCGPSICGTCYEVGPEVHTAVRPEGRDPVRAPIDLVEVIGERALRAGVSAGRMTGSVFCTRCQEGDRFYSHRGGSSGRQLGVLGIHP